VPEEFPLLDELLPVLDVLDVEEAGDEAEDAVVSVEFPSPTPLELPLGEAADAATDDLDELPGGEVNPDVALLVLGATIAKGVGLFLEVDVVKS